MSEITIRHCDTLVNEKASAIAVEGWNFLIEKGFCDDTTLVQYSHKAFIAEEDGLQVGILTYDKVDWTRSFSVILGYVRPEYRGKGIYRKLWDALVDKARVDGIVYIDGSTSVRNEKMQAVMEKLGRSKTSYSYRFWL